MKSNLTDVDVEFVTETGSAWLFDIGEDEPVWIPKSMGEYCPEDGILSLPERAAIEKGLV